MYSRNLNTILLKRFLLITIILFTSFLSLNTTMNIPDNIKIRNYKAFAKVYGYVRYFYPGDEAAKIDWEAFAVHGMKTVESSKDDDELVQNLRDLFLPVAPLAEVYKKVDEKPFDIKRVIPSDTTGLKIVAWQHKGVGISSQGPYSSVRLNRFSNAENSFGNLINSVKAADYRGKKIRLKAAVRVGVNTDYSDGHIWLRVDRENHEAGFFDNMDKNPIRESNWAEYEITGEVAADAADIVFGCFLKGEGTLWADNFSLSVLEGSKWKEIKINNPDFENDQLYGAPKDWLSKNDEYEVMTINENPFKGKYCVTIVSNLKKQLFDKHPVPGDYFTKYIADGIVCRIPLAVYSDENGTMPRCDAKLFDDLANKLSSYHKEDLSGRDLYTRLADIAIMWNIIRHFYPYFDLFDIKWEEALDKYLERAYNDADENSFNETLNRMMSEMNDGHAGSSNSKLKKIYYPAFIVDFAEGKIVVSKLLEKNTKVKEGDVIIEIDGVRTEDRIKQLSETISSATLQWKNYIISEFQFLKGDENSDMKLKIKRDSKIIEVTVKRDLNRQKFWTYNVKPEYRPEKTAELKKGIYYIDMERASMDDINSLMLKLEKAKGIICDLRGYPNGNHDFIAHLTDIDITSARWNVPEIIYPDMEKIAGFDTSGRWEMKPLKPRLKCKVVYLTNGSAISYAESCMGIIEAYKLAEIVGEPTAGTNGNVNPVTLIGGYTVYWTGMKVLKHDGSQHHGIGIQPTVLVHRTIKGIKEKRDEFLEEAIEIIEAK